MNVKPFNVVDPSSYTVLDIDFVNSYSSKIPNWGFNGMSEIVYHRTYSRYMEALERKELWHETIARTIEGAQRIGAGYTSDEAKRLFDYMFNMKGSFSGRALWQLGTPLVDEFGGGSAVNCSAVTIRSIEDFCFIFDMLVLGSGVGFSVEQKYVKDLPPVMAGVEVTHELTNDADFIVPDSREGWSELIRRVLEAYLYTGKSFSYSTVLIRPEGAPLKRIGGTASGPQPLIDGIEHIQTVLKQNTGAKLSSVACSDIANILGWISVSGNLRRAAQIAIGDNDADFVYAKNWVKNDIPFWRSQSNNTVVASDVDELVPEFWDGYAGEGEPYGLFNKSLAQSYGRLDERIDDFDATVPNPCAEILLNGDYGEVCNLATIVLPRMTSIQEFFDVSTLLYKAQKAVTDLEYPHDRTTRIVRENRRLGQSITGWMQSSTLQLSWVSAAYENLRYFDEIWSKKTGRNPSIKLTSVQPSGTLGGTVLASTPGAHPAYAPYYMRTVRMNSNDSLVDFCASKGYKIEPAVRLDGTLDDRTSVVYFPCETPAGAVTSQNLSAVQHLNWIRQMQTDWADNAVSCTVYYRKEELPEIKDWLSENFTDSLKTVSFLLHSDHGFAQAPYQEIDRETYERETAKIDHTKHLKFEDNSTDLLDMADCEGGACPIR